MLRDKNITVNIAELSFTPLSNGKVAFAVDESTGMDENRGTTVVIAKAF